MNKNKTALLTGAFALVAGIGVLGAQSYLHDLKLEAQATNEILQGHIDQLITVTTDGVTRKGYACIVPVFDRMRTPTYEEKQEGRSGPIIFSSGKEMVTVDLRVTSGTDKLPLWQKIFGGAKVVEYIPSI